MATSRAGDQVFVDRITYQFRDPRRADVFVFRTTGIRGIEINLDPTFGSQFYIKRLAGLPGDALRIDAPRLFLNGKEAANAPFRRVMSCENGYRGYSNPGAARYLTTPWRTSRCRSDPTSRSVTTATTPATAGTGASSPRVT